MMQSQFDFGLAAPEIILTVMGMVILILDALSSGARRTLAYGLSLVTLAVLAAVSFWQWNMGLVGETFFGMYIADPLAHLLKMASYLAVALTLVYGREYMQTRDMLRGGEFYVLVLFALLGQMVMISAGNFLTIYLGLELMSLALYALVAIRRDHAQSTEAAMKYFVLGALASGFMLYGMSMLYGATGNLDLRNIADAVNSGQIDYLPLTFGVVFLVAGLAFKLGAVPFHMWVPDVYQGSPTAVTLVLAAAPKLAAFAITLRILVVGLGDLTTDWQPMLLILAFLSLAIGNLTAIMQTNFKRMLAYSTISHMGFILLGLASGSLDGDKQFDTESYGSALFYMLTYVLTTLATFGLMMLMSREGHECEDISDLKGLNRRSPWMAALLLLLMCSLAGLPPLVGFDAKLLILQTLLKSDRLWLAVVAVLFSLIGAFYYLRVIKVMYFDEPETAAPAMEPVWWVPRSLIIINGLAVLVLGLMPNDLLVLCLQAMRATLAF
ncbi:MAG: NADH-quinone oxidoreductase subunit NuoN [Burkholderiaceae bacterium]|jgi:NADH-quinone oxidoreductase subunit N|nr:NADH-quinone oxidoreductase subunit NuoN [Burkholderiaceae bacterium]